MPEDLPRTLDVRVTPRARREEVKIEDTPEGGVVYKVYVRTPPEDGRANEAVLRLLAEKLGVPKSRLALLRGQASRNKVVRVV